MPKTEYQLSFDAERHAYALNGRPVPGVTSVLSAAFGDPWRLVPSESREYALKLGRAVHQWTQAVDVGMTERPQSAQMQGYVAAWEKFKAERVVELVAVECQVFSARYLYAGTTDRVAVLRVQSVSGGLRSIVDIKTGQAIHPFAAIQTAGYAMAWEERNHPQKIHHRATVLLKQDGTYQVEDHTDKTDRNVWLAALSVVGWKQKHRLTMTPVIEET